MLLYMSGFSDAGHMVTFPSAWYPVYKSKHLHGFNREIKISDSPLLIGFQADFLSYGKFLYFHSI